MEPIQRAPSLAIPAFPQWFQVLAGLLPTVIATVVAVASQTTEGVLHEKSHP